MPTPGAAKRILVVDDDDALREVLEHVLRKEGLEVTGASDGQNAKEKILKEKPDLVIMDLMMPGLSGHEVIRSLQMEEGASQIPIIVVTGRYTGDRSYEQMVRQEPNVVEFFKKPLNYVALTEKIQQVLKS